VFTQDPVTDHMLLG